MGVFKKVASRSLEEGINLEGPPSPNSSDPDKRKRAESSLFLFPEILKNAGQRTKAVEIPELTIHLESLLSHTYVQTYECPRVGFMRIASVSSRRVAPPISDALPIRRLLPTSALLAHPPVLSPLIDSPSAPTPTSIMLPSPLDCLPVCLHSLLSS